MERGAGGASSNVGANAWGQKNGRVSSPKGSQNARDSCSAGGEGGGGVLEVGRRLEERGFRQAERAH